jgi:hypothetical protein
MYNDIMTNRRLAMAIVLVQLLLLGGLFLYQNFFIAIAAVVSFVVAAAVWRFGFVIKPIIAHQTNVIEGFGNYEIPPSQDVLIKKEGNRYFASAYMLIRFTHSSTEKTPEQIAVMRQAYERTISSLNYVYKISNLICPVDITPYVDKIKEKRSSAESRLSEISSLPPTSNQGAEIARLKREIESFETQLERIQAGERPMKSVNYAVTCASSTSKDDAMAKAKQQAAELKTMIAGTMDSEVIPLCGDDIKRCFEWEFILPEKGHTDDFLY